MAGDWKTRRNRRGREPARGGWTGGVLRGLFVGLGLGAGGLAAVVLTLPPAERDPLPGPVSERSEAVENAELREARGRSGPSAAGAPEVAAIEDTALAAPGAVPRVAAPIGGPGRPRLLGATIGEGDPSPSVDAEADAPARPALDIASPLDLAPAPGFDAGPAILPPRGGDADDATDETLTLDAATLTREEALAALAAIEAAEADAAPDAGPPAGSATLPVGFSTMALPDAPKRDEAGAAASERAPSATGARSGDAGVEVPVPAAGAPEAEATSPPPPRADAAIDPVGTGERADPSSIDDQARSTPADEPRMAAAPAADPVEAIGVASETVAVPEPSAPRPEIAATDERPRPGSPIPRSRPVLVDRTSPEPTAFAFDDGATVPLAVVLVGASSDRRDDLDPAVTLALGPDDAAGEGDARERVLVLADLADGRRVAVRPGAVQPLSLDEARAAIETAAPVAVMLDPERSGPARLDDEMATILADLGVGYLEARTIGGAAAVRRARDSGARAVAVERRLAAGTSEDAILDALDAAAGSARREGGAVVVVPAGPAATAAIGRWVEAQRGGVVALAPLSAVLAATR